MKFIHILGFGLLATATPMDGPYQGRPTRGDDQPHGIISNEFQESEKVAEVQRPNIHPSFHGNGNSVSSMRADLDRINPSGSKDEYLAHVADILPLRSSKVADDASFAKRQGSDQNSHGYPVPGVRFLSGESTLKEENSFAERQDLEGPTHESGHSGASPSLAGRVGSELAIESSSSENIGFAQESGITVVKRQGVDGSGHTNWRDPDRYPPAGMPGDIVRTCPPRRAC